MAAQRRKQSGEQSGEQSGGRGGEPGGGPDGAALPRVVLSDPKAIKALAHPARLAVLDELFNGTELTATECAAIAGLSPSAMSYHLRELEKAGIVQRAESGDGRERPWRAAGAGVEVDVPTGSPLGAAATATVAVAVLEQATRQLGRWLSRSDTESPRWRDVGGFAQTRVWLTVDEAEELYGELQGVLRRFRDRTEAERPAGARRVRVGTMLFPADEPESAAIAGTATDTATATSADTEPPPTDMTTPYAELDSVLTDLVASAREILAGTFVGAYLQGSFALGAGDLDSDCDFVIATTTLPSGPAEQALRALHDEIPTRPGHWTGHLEGSYADVGSLRSAAGLGTPWLYCDHGHRELVWDLHCNSLHTRWILRNRGVTLAGPPIADLVDEVSPAELRASMRAALPRLKDDLLGWLPLDVAWSQRYLVSNFCRVLYTLATAEVASKQAAMEWARDRFAPAWRPLLDQCVADRARGFDRSDPPRPGALAAALAFADEALRVAADW